MGTRPVCDCGHFREDHPDRGPCGVWPCRCGWWFGYYPTKTVYLPEEDWHAEGAGEQGPPPLPQEIPGQHRKCPGGQAIADTQVQCAAGVRQSRRPARDRHPTPGRRRGYHSRKGWAMPRRPCLDCGTLSRGSRCPAHTEVRARARDAVRGSSARRGYDHAHRARRAALLPHAIGTPCPRCGYIMLLSQALDLGHSTALAHDPGAVGDRIEHSACNRSAGGRTRRS